MLLISIYKIFSCNLLSLVFYRVSFSFVFVRLILSYTLITWSFLIAIWRQKDMSQVKEY